MLVSSLQASLDVLLLLLYFIVLAMTLFSSLVYYAEKVGGSFIHYHCDGLVGLSGEPVLRHGCTVCITARKIMGELQACKRCRAI